VPEVDLDNLARALYTRRHEALTIPFEGQTMSSGAPQEHECHNNTDRWVLENPGHKSVRGWMVFDWHQTTAGWWPICHFAAHSVVERPDGSLFDLTPSKAEQRYPFLRHDGPEGEFEAIVLAGRVRLEYVIDVD
jgi:hypothetical protein